VVVTLGSGLSGPVTQDCLVYSFPADWAGFILHPLAIEQKPFLVHPVCMTP
jgi:hypothetical protein